MSLIADSLDDFIREDLKRRGVPAIVFGVFRDGHMIRSGAYGFANLEWEVPATTDTVFEIGSVSKPFTATLIMQLMEEGKLRLDDPIGRFVDGLPDAWAGIELRNLLSHTSGIPDIEAIFGYESYRNVYTVEEIVRVANSRPVDFAPGAKWSYSNTNYYLLGLAAGNLDGAGYDRSLRDRILDPLGMTQTRQSDPWAIIPNRASGYMRSENGDLVNRDPMQPSACLGAGTIVSTIADMAKWDAAIAQGRLLSRTTQEMMWQPTKPADGTTVDCGLGWFTDPWRGRASVSHNGGTAGFSCDYRRFLDSGIAFMVFSNLYNTGTAHVGIRAVDSVEPGVSYVSAKPLAAVDPDVGPKLLAGMRDVAAGAPSSLDVAPRMLGDYNEASRTEWKARLEGLVRFEPIAHETYPPRAAPNGENVSETYVYRLITREAVLFITFMLTPDGRVGFQTRTEC